MRRCIKAGATKINVNRIVLDDYYDYVWVETAARMSHTSLMEGAVEKVVNQTVEWMEIVSSAGKAPSL